MRRANTVAIAALAAVLCLGFSFEPVTAGGAARPITYSTQPLGAVEKDLSGFRRIVAATLNDPRGWSLGGRVEFREVQEGGRLTIALATPTVIEGVGACSAFYSCRAGSRVLINSDRWRHATVSYRGRALLHSYRQMVINHEVGHALGFGHVDCARPGESAAVMQQQSKRLGGCERNPWPLASERAQHAARVGLRAPAVRAPFALGRRSSHVPLGARRSTVLATLGHPGQRRRAGGARIDVYSRPRVAIAYAKGRVAAITTRSRADVGAHGLAVGRRLTSRLERTCTGGGASRCEVAARHRRGHRTTLILRNGRIAAMRVERRAASATGQPSTSARVLARVLVPSALMAAVTRGSIAAECAWWWARAGRCGATTG